MPRVEATIPKQVASEIERLVEAGEFISREHAYEDLLSKGISVFDVADDAAEEMGEDVFTQTEDDLQDPALDDF